MKKENFFYVVIIVGGVIGCTIAWELSKYKVNVVVCKKMMLIEELAAGIAKCFMLVLYTAT